MPAGFDTYPCIIVDDSAADRKKRIIIMIRITIMIIRIG